MGCVCPVCPCFSCTRTLLYIFSGDSPVSSPSKRPYVFATGSSSKAGRKRKRKEDTMEAEAGAHHRKFSYIA